MTDELTDATSIEAADKKYVMRPWTHPAGEPVIVAKRLEQGAETAYLTSARQDHTLFVGETSLNLVYQFSERVTTFAGYQAIWIDGLALASENLQTNPEILRYGPGQLNHSGNVVYHGPHVGLTIVW